MTWLAVKVLMSQLFFVTGLLFWAVVVAVAAIIIGILVIRVISDLDYERHFKKKE